MQKLSLDAVTRQLRDRLSTESGGRHTAETVYGGHDHVLRQTVIALAAGAEMGEHVNPGEATVYVLLGRVRLVSGEQSWEGRAGDFLIAPNARHKVEALEESVILLTVAKLP